MSEPAAAAWSLGRGRSIQQRRPQFLQEVAQELQVKRQAGEIAGRDCPLSPIWHCSGTRSGDLRPKTCQERPVAARHEKARMTTRRKQCGASWCTW
jgi:hypothetical protein